MLYFPQDVATRWGTKHKMIKRVLEQLPAIRRVLVEDRKHGHLNPTWQDVSVLESINAAIKPMADFTDVLSGEKYVTVSSVKPVLELLKGELLSPDPNDTALTANIKANMCRVLKEKYSPPEIQNLLTKATMLDPRYHAEVLDDVKEKLLQELLDMNEEEGKGECASGEAAGGNEAAGRNEGSESGPPASKKKRLCDLLQHRRNLFAHHQTQAPVPKRAQADVELTRFLQEEPVDASSDPLMWWRDNHKRFPLVAKLAQKYMCICATSTSSERLFSTAGNIVTPVRSCLKPHKVNMLVFLSRNLPNN